MISQDILKYSRATCIARPSVLLGSLVFLTPLLTLLVPLSLATLLPLLVLFAVICRAVSGAPRFRFSGMPAIVVAAIIIVAAASAGWSFSAELTWDKLPRTAVIAVVGVVLLAAMSGLEPAQGRTISKAFLAGIALAFVSILAGRVIGEFLIRTGAIEGAVPHFLNNFNRPLSLLSIMIWPAAVTLTDRRPAYGIAAVIACLALFATFQTGAATAAIAFGMIVFAAVYAAPRIMAPLTGALLGISVLLAPTIGDMLPPPKAMFEQLSLPRSAYHRLLIWQFASEKITERPLLGWGFNTSRAIPGGEENLDVSEAA
jgi:O-antigen ligase